LKKDIEDMIAFSVKYSMKNSVKKIYMNDNSEYYSNENPMSLAKLYILWDKNMDLPPSIIMII